MRIPYTHNLSLMLEEMSRREDSAVGKCLQVVLYKSLAEKLWTPFKAACFNPVITLGVVVVLYLVFSIIYAPLWLASLLVTSYGAFILFLVFLNYLANLISRKIAFAGSNVQLKKEVSAQFFRQISGYLEAQAVQISDFTAVLLLGASGQIPFQEMPQMDIKLREVMDKVSGLFSLVTLLRQAISLLTSELTATPTELLLLNQLCTAAEEQISALTAMQPTASAYISALDGYRRAYHAQYMRTGSGRTVPQMSQPPPKGTPELFKVASHCIKLSKALKVAIDNCKPPPAPEDDGGIVSKIRSVLNLTQGLEGCEKVTFPYMRCMLKQRFKAEQFTLTGCDKNTIDGIIFPACLGASMRHNAAEHAGISSTGSGKSGAQGAQESKQSSDALGGGTNALSEPTSASNGIEHSPVGLVLFCSPNAAFYEGMCQCDVATSWLGYYTQKGYDVCMFNYRGYGLSSGDPDPHSVKQDAGQVYEHLQRTRRPYRIILHGESIGGMVATHLARTYPVDALVCDRTFCSLDATAARLMGRWAGWGLKYLTLWSTNVGRDFLAVTCPKIVLQDPDDEIIANLASLKNGVAMRLVMGDLDWVVLSEPAEYAYARYLKAELPHKEDEPAMLMEAGDSSRVLTERFVAHFFACVADLARRSTALTARPSRRAGTTAHRGGGTGSGIVTAATPRGAGRAGGAGGGMNASEHGKQGMSAGGGASGEQSRSRRVVMDGAAEDGCSSSHSSRHGGGKDFGLPSTEAQDDAVVEEGDEGGGDVYDSDASGASKLLGVMGLGSFSEDNWGAEVDPAACAVDGGDDVFRDVESGEESGGNTPSSPPSATSRRHPRSALKKGGRSNSSSQRQPLSRQERLAQFCATPMRDPVIQPSSGGAQGGERRTLGPAAITKAWAAVGRTDGGSGQLLGQALSGGLEGVRAWVCAWLVWSRHAARDHSLPQSCTEMAQAVKDLQLLSDELHVAELQHDRAVQFLLRALEALIRRRDALIFHKPPLGMMLQGAMAYHRLVSDGSSTPTGTAGTDAVPVAAASPVEQTLNSALAVVTRWAHIVRKALASNRFASIDACGDLERFRCPGFLSQVVGGRTCGPASADRDSADTASLYTTCTVRGDALTSGTVFTSATVPSPQHMPYVGSVVALHSGHNGWLAQTELDSLTDFLVQASLA